MLQIVDLFLCIPTISLLYLDKLFCLPSVGIKSPSYVRSKGHIAGSQSQCTGHVCVKVDAA